MASRSPCSTATWPNKNQIINKYSCVQSPEIQITKRCLKAGFHLGKLSSGQESFLCVRAISSDRKLTRQRKLSYPFPSWEKLSWVETSLKTKYSIIKNQLFMNTNMAASQVSGKRALVWRPGSCVITKELEQFAGSIKVMLHRTIFNDDY